MTKNKNNKRGLTLIETLFVLGIMAILLGMIMLLYSRSVEREKINNIMIEIGELKEVANDLYKDQIQNIPEDTEISNTLLKSGLIQNNYNNNGTLTTPFGQTIYVMLNQWGGKIAFQIYNLSISQCVELATMDAGLPSGIHDININDASNGTYGVSSISPLQATQKCNLNQNTNFIIWNYYDL